MSATMTSKLRDSLKFKVALPTDEAFETQFGATSEAIASSEMNSTVFIKKLLAVAISNITYLRSVITEESFSDRYLGDLQLKIIRTGPGSQPVARNLINYVKGGFDAIERKFLKKLTMWFHEKADRPDIIKEAYIFQFNYFEDDVNMSLSRNDQLVSGPQKGTDIKEATISFLKNLLVAVEVLEPLPSPIFMNWKMSYHDDTPAGYHPPGFVPFTTLLRFPKTSTMTKIDVGDVKTNHHGLNLVIRGTVEEDEVEEGAARELDVKYAQLPGFFGLDCSSPDLNGSKDVSQGVSTTQAAPAAAPAADPAPAAVPAVPTSQELPETQSSTMAVQCVCEGSQDGMMIVCGVCGTWQHGICYGVFPENRHRLRGHVCLRCVKEGALEEEVGGKRKRPKEAILLDPMMEKMDSRELKRNALLRRTLSGIGDKEVKHLSIGRLRRTLTMEQADAEFVMRKLKSDKLIHACSCPSNSQKSNAEDQAYAQWDLDQNALQAYLEKAGKEAEKLHQVLREGMEDSTYGDLDRKNQRTKTPQRKSARRPTPMGGGSKRR